jgi:hypothetical protein
MIRKHGVKEIALIIERSFAAVRFDPAQQKIALIMKSVVLNITEQVFWLGYREAMRDMSKNESRIR